MPSQTEKAIAVSNSEWTLFVFFDHPPNPRHGSLDHVIRVMKRTGADMSDRYKETSRGGLAVNLSEC